MKHIHTLLNLKNPDSLYFISSMVNFAGTGAGAVCPSQQTRSVTDTGRPLFLQIHLLTVCGLVQSSDVL